MSGPGQRDAPAGLVLALAAYGIWGLFPLFFRLLEGASAWEVVAHRALWSLPAVLLAVAATGRLKAAFAILRDKTQARVMTASALLLFVNWGFFVWGVNAGRTVEVSLGYYINPLINVLLGFLLLGERFSRAQTLAIALAALAVVWLTVAAGVFPWLALLLAGSFSLYGYLRKTMRADSLTGYFGETLVLLPVALALLSALALMGMLLRFGHDAGLTGLLILSGPVTTVALLIFAAAARRIRYSTMGLLQYLTPTMHFLIAVFVFGEPFTAHHAVAFTLIWLALAIYAIDGWSHAHAAASGGGDSDVS